MGVVGVVGGGGGGGWYSLTNLHSSLDGNNVRLRQPERRVAQQLRHLVGGVDGSACSVGSTGSAGGLGVDGLSAAGLHL